MTPTSSGSSRLGRRLGLRVSLLPLALALGAAACGPTKTFCADAADNGYNCWKIADAGPESDVNDGPQEERGAIVVGDDEQQAGGTPDAPADTPAADAPTDSPTDTPADLPADAGAQ